MLLYKYKYVYICILYILIAYVYMCILEMMNFRSWTKRCGTECNEFERAIAAYVMLCRRIVIVKHREGEKASIYIYRLCLILSFISHNLSLFCAFVYCTTRFARAARKLWSHTRRIDLRPIICILIVPPGIRRDSAEHNILYTLTQHYLSHIFNLYVYTFALLRFILVFFFLFSHSIASRAQFYIYIVERKKKLLNLKKYIMMKITIIKLEKKIFFLFISH